MRRQSSPVQPQVLPLRNREANPDRVGLRDRGEQAPGSGSDQVSDLGLGESDDAVERRSDVRVPEVERGGQFRRAGGLEAGFGGLFVGEGVVVFLLAHRVGFRQWFETGFLQLRIVELGLGRRDLGLGPRHRRLEGLGIDLIQQLAPPDLSTFREAHGFEESGHPRPDLHGLRAACFSHRLDIDGHILLEDVGKRHLGRRSRGRRFFLAGREDERQKKDRHPGQRVLHGRLSRWRCGLGLPEKENIPFAGLGARGPARGAGYRDRPRSLCRSLMAWSSASACKLQLSENQQRYPESE